MNSLLIIHSTANESPEQLEWCLRAFRTAYPQMPGLLISDGIATWHVRAAKKHQLYHVLGERLKNSRYGSAWVKRMLSDGIEIAERVGCEYLWKIDPDTHVIRPFQTPPPQADCFGHIHKASVEHVQGGSMFLKLAAARRLLTELAAETGFERAAAWLPKELPSHVVNWATRSGWLSSDFIILKLLERCGLSSADWAEVFSVCNLTPMPEMLTNYAVVHPVKVRR